MRGKLADQVRSASTHLIPHHDYGLFLGGVGKLEAGGVITGYHAAVAPESLGYSMSALIGVFLSDTARTDAVSAALREVAEVEDCWFVAGEESYVVKVRVADVSALEQMIGTLNGIAGVARTRTTVVLSTKFEGRVQPAG